MHIRIRHVGADNVDNRYWTLRQHIKLWRLTQGYSSVEVVTTPWTVRIDHDDIYVMSNALFKYLHAKDGKEYTLYTTGKYISIKEIGDADSMQLELQLEEPVTVGVFLRQYYFHPSVLTQAVAAKCMKLSPSTVCGILSGKTRITPLTSLKLGAFFGHPDEYWYDLQAKCDLRAAQIHRSIILASVVPWSQMKKEEGKSVEEGKDGA